MTTICVFGGTGFLGQRVVRRLVSEGTAVRVAGGKKDDLQAAIALVRKSVTDIPLQFQNFRD